MTDDIPVRAATEDERRQAMDCLRCGSLIIAEGVIDLRMGGHSGGWSVLFGGWADLDEQLLKLNAFRCPSCGHVEFRMPPA